MKDFQQRNLLLDLQVVALGPFGHSKNKKRRQEPLSVFSCVHAVCQLKPHKTVNMGTRWPSVMTTASQEGPSDTEPQRVLTQTHRHTELGVEESQNDKVKQQKHTQTLHESSCVCSCVSLTA